MISIACLAIAVLAIAIAVAETLRNRGLCNL